MINAHRAEAIRGKTIRLSWTTGPTKGATHEHVFHANGTVEWHALPHAGEASSPAKGAPDVTRRSEPGAEYAAIQVSDDVYLVSYLAASGYTLTVALNFDDSNVVGFASGAKEWYPIEGTFKLVD